MAATKKTNRRCRNKQRPDATLNHRWTLLSQYRPIQYIRKCIPMEAIRRIQRPRLLQFSNSRLSATNIHTGRKMGKKN